MVDRPRALLNIGFAAALGLEAISCTPVSVQERINPIPTECQVPEEALRPSSLDHSSLYMHSSGVVVIKNQWVEKRVDTKALQTFNTDSAYGVNLDPDVFNVTYFFADSFKDDKLRQAAFSLVRKESPYLSSLWCQEYNRVGMIRYRYSIISDSDQINAFLDKNPLYSADSSFFPIGYSEWLSCVYAALSGENITDPYQTPIVSPHYTSQLFRVPPLIDPPITVTRIDPQYMNRVLGR